MVGLRFLVAVLLVFYAASSAQAFDRYLLKPMVIIDTKSGLAWTRNANLLGKQMTNGQADKFIAKLNSQKYGGYSNWRMPRMKDFDDSFDFAIWSKDMEAKNRRMAKRMGIAGLRSGYYFTSSAHMTAIRYWPDRPVPDRDYSTGAIRLEKLDVLNWKEGGWWNDKGYLWPVAGGKPQ